MGTLSEFVNHAQKTRGAVVMAVVNTTPDSFFDGGKYLDHEAAKRHIDQLLHEGADMIDIGAESTRPGAAAIGAAEQLDRAAPAVEYAVNQGAWVSIDTTLPDVAREALKLGARVVNDVSCGANAQLAAVTQEANADLIIMHSRGSMTEMKGFSDYDPKAYDDVVQDVFREWRVAEKRANNAGLTSERIWFDPGLGFHKNVEQSSTIMQCLTEFRGLGAGLVVGASRKSFIGALDDSKPGERLGGSIAACLHAVQRGASILRVHDVKPSVQALLAHQAWSADGAPASAGGAYA